MRRTRSDPDGVQTLQESPKKKRRFLDGYKVKRKSKEMDEVDRYLSEPTGDLSDLERFPFIKQVYMYDRFLDSLFQHLYD